MRNGVSLKYFPRDQYAGRRVEILSVGAEESLAICTAPAGMSSLQGWDGCAWQLRGYIVSLEERPGEPPMKGPYTLASLNLSKEVREELNVFFTLFCEIEDWEALGFTVDY